MIRLLSGNTDMSQSKKPLAMALGAAFLASAIAPMASAEVNPFSAQQLSGGYDLPSYGSHGGEGKCGEGKCGEDKDGEDKDGEGKCGEGKCGDDDKGGEGKCGEGKCGG
jgi:uncharacterized low-complexity protein